MTAENDRTSTVQDRMTRVLIVDDEANLRFAIRESLEPLGCDCTEAATGQEGIDLYRQNRFDLVLLDYRMPGLNGIETLKEIRRFDVNAVVLFITAYGTRELALEALNEGAYDYFTKPFDVDELRATVKRAMEKRHLRRRVEVLTRQMDSALGFDQIIGATSEMREVYRLIQQVAGENVTVLILGESGTGKELVASAIHRHSGRRSGPFVPLNCAAIPEALLESELFGHERGAFTGAHALKTGKFEQAGGGTLFLDEIGDMDLHLQAKILRVLQEGRFQRVGGSQLHDTDVRIVAATNKDLAAAVASGEFREDLYYRLNVIPIFLPPLRHRRSDLPLLIEHFVQRANEQFGKSVSGIAREVMDRFQAYHWPGNIRELENVIVRAVLLAPSAVISNADLPLAFDPGDDALLPTQTSAPSDKHKQPSPGPAGDYPFPAALELLDAVAAGRSYQDVIDEQLDQLEKEVLKSALDRCRWRRGETAEFLQISRRNLLRKMQKLGIE